MPIQYDKKAARFRDSRGRFVDASSIRHQTEKAIEMLGKDFRALSKRLNNDDLSLDEWKSSMREKIKTLHILSASVGRGGRRQMSNSDWGKVGANIKKEYKFLENLSEEIKKGKIAGNRLEYRASLYARSARKSFSEAEKQANKTAGKMLCRRVLHASESCLDCISWARKGFIPIDEQPPIGSLICHSNCRCEIEYKSDKDEIASGINAKGYFFLNEEIYDYEPEVEVIGQYEEYSCVPAVVQMILNDYQERIPQRFLMDELGVTEQGTPISRAAKVLNDRLGKELFVYNADIDFEDLKKSVKKSSAIVFVKNKIDLHALIVDKFADGKVFLRDPLPESAGKAYAVDEEVFLKFWKISSQKGGKSVIIKDDD